MTLLWVGWRARVMDNVHAHAVLGYAETLGRLVIERGHPRLVREGTCPGLALLIGVAAEMLLAKPSVAMLYLRRLVTQMSLQWGRHDTWRQATGNAHLLLFGTWLGSFAIGSVLALDLMCFARPVLG